MSIDRNADSEMTSPAEGVVLASDRCRIVADATGSRVASIIVDGCELLTQKTAEDLLWGCYPMVPWAGRLDSGRFQFGGEDHQLPAEFDSHAIHGFGVHHEWQQVAVDRLKLDLAEFWDLGGVAETTFAVSENAAHMRLTLTADTHRLPYVLGWHPCFSRSVGAHVATLSFEPGYWWERTDRHLPSGRQLLVPTGPWDDCFGDVRSSPVLAWSDDLGITLEAPTTTWVVYDEVEHTICVEPQTGPPNAFNMADPPVLEIGQTASLELTLRFGSNDGTVRP